MTDPAVTDSSHTAHDEAARDSDSDWRHQAACRGSKDPDLFFPVSTIGPGAEQNREAKAICWSCPVRSECLDWALTTGQDVGVWGGLDEEERRALKRRRSLTPAVRAS